VAIAQSLPAIAGTTLFDGAQARKGCALNKLRQVHRNHHIPISNTAPGLLLLESR